MFDPATDPLGINVQGRARDKRFDMAVHGLQSAVGPLPDPAWDGYFQATAEAAGGKPVGYKSSGAEAPDLTRDPAWIQQQQGMGPFPMGGINKSTQLGTQNDSVAARGLMRAANQRDGGKS